MNEDNFEHWLDPDYLPKDEQIIRLAKTIPISYIYNNNGKASSTVDDFIFEQDDGNIIRFTSFNIDKIPPIIRWKKRNWIYFFAEVHIVFFCLPLAFYEEYLLHGQEGNQLIVICYMYYWTRFLTEVLPKNFF